MPEIGNNLDRRFRDEVNVFRQNLVETGTVVNITGYGDVALQGRDSDKILLQGLLLEATQRIGAGDVVTLTPFMGRDNTLHYLTPPQVAEMVAKGQSWVSAVYVASWAIKAENPASWETDSRWTV